MRKHLTVLFFVFLNTLSAHSATITLRAARDSLLFRNFDIVNSRELLCKRSYEVDEAKALWYPSVDAIGSVSHLTENQTTSGVIMNTPVNMTIPNSKDKTEFGLDATYPLTSALVNIYNVQYKKANRDILGTQNMALENALSLRLGAIYLAWAMSRKQVAVQQTFIEQLRASLAQIKNRSEQGLVANAAVLDAQSRECAADVDFVSVQNLADSLRNEIMNLTQISDTSITPEDFSFPLDTASLAALDTCTANNLRPELQTMDILSSQLVLFDRIIFAQRYPVIAGMVGYRYGQPGLHMGGDKFMSYGILGVQLKFNIFDGFRVASQLSQNRQQMEIVRNQKKQQQSAYIVLVKNARLQLARTRSLENAATASLAASEALAKDAQNNLDAGTITATDYLNAQTALAKAKLGIHQASFQKNMAVLQLHFALGKTLTY